MLNRINNSNQSNKKNRKRNNNFFLLFLFFVILLLTIFFVNNNSSMQYNWKKSNLSDSNTTRNGTKNKLKNKIKKEIKKEINNNKYNFNKIIKLSKEIEKWKKLIWYRKWAINNKWFKYIIWNVKSDKDYTLIYPIVLLNNIKWIWLYLNKKNFKIEKQWIKQIDNKIDTIKYIDWLEKVIKDDKINFIIPKSFVVDWSWNIDQFKLAQ